MDDDERFLSQFIEAPRPEFVAGLRQRYQRINQPMNAQRTPMNLRRAGFSIAVTLFMLVTAGFIYPPTRAQALEWIRQIGFFTFTTSQPPAVQQPTAAPPDPSQKPLTTWSAEEASQLAGFTVLLPRNLPEGYFAHGPLSVMPNGEGKIVVSTYSNPDKDTFILINQHYGQEASYTDHITGQETYEDVQVNGYAGVWITGRKMTSPIGGVKSASGQPYASNWLVWEENGIVYSVISDGLNSTEAEKLAESLR